MINPSDLATIDNPSYRDITGSNRNGGKIGNEGSGVVVAAGGPAGAALIGKRVAMRAQGSWAQVCAFARVRACVCPFSSSPVSRFLSLSSSSST